MEPPKLKFFNHKDIFALVDSCTSDFATNHEFSDDQLTDLQSNATCLIHSYLRKLVGRPANASLMFEKMFLFMKHPLLTEQRVLSLLLMLREFLTLTTKFPPEALGIIKGYYLWPKPVGDIARDLLQEITIENKSPGHAMHKLFLEENPELLRASGRTGKERTIHVIFDPAIASSKVLLEHLRFGEINDVTLPQLQIDLLSNMISTMLDVDRETIGLEYLSKDELAKYFEEVCTLLEEAILLPASESIALLSKEFALLIEAVAEVRNARSASQPNFAKPKLPNLPSLNFYPISCSADYPPIVSDPAEVKQAVQTLQGKYIKKTGYDTLTTIMTQYAAYTDPKSRPRVRIAVIGNDALIHNIMSSYILVRETAPNSIKGVDLQFFIIPASEGPVNILSSFIHRYDTWYARHITLLTRFVPKLLSLVSPTSNLASTVNSSSLYNGLDPKKTYNPNYAIDSQDAMTSTKVQPPKMTMSNSSNPAIGEDNPMTSSALGLSSSAAIQKLEDDENLPPAMSLRVELENYLRWAKQRLEIGSFMIECITGDNSSPLYLGFYAKVEIGLKPYCRYLQKTQDLPENTPLATIQSHKMYKYNPNNLVLKYSQMSLLGLTKQAQTESKSYYSVVLSNLPNPGEKVPMAEPNKPWVEMTTTEADPKKKKAKPSEKDLEQSPTNLYHVFMAEVEAAEKKGSFHILVDTVLYGPFTKIKISRSLSKDNQEVLHTIPVMTFFPTSNN